MENTVLEKPNVVESPVIEAPKQFIKDVRLARLSTIYFTMCIACLVISMLAALSSFIIPIFYAFVMLFAIVALILMLFLIVLTFGLILAVPKNPIVVLYNFISNSNMEKVTKISQKFLLVLPYLCIIGLICAVISIIAISFTKEKKVGRIVGLSILSVIFGLTLIVYYALGGVIWQS